MRMEHPYRRVEDGEILFSVPAYEGIARRCSSTGRKWPPIGPPAGRSSVHQELNLPAPLILDTLTLVVRTKCLVQAVATMVLSGGNPW